VFVINVGYPLLGVQKWEGVPEHESFKSKCAIHERQGDKESPKVCTHLKSCEPLYTCPRAPFIETQKDFYIPKLPSNLENIPSVNMYKNALYIPWFTGLISYIYKFATSSHFKPGLLRWCLWLGFFLTPNLLFTKITAHWGSRIKTSPNSRTSQIPDYRTSQISDSQNFADSNHPEIDNRFANRSQLRLLLFAFYQKVSMMYEIHQDFFMNVAFSRNRTLLSEDDLQIY
jgi:hypothetical protein